jgi:hypothetical protein
MMNNLLKLHTTPMGLERIRKNLELDVPDVVAWCVNKIKDENCKKTRKGTKSRGDG